MSGKEAPVRRSPPDTAVKNESPVCRQEAGEDQRGPGLDNQVESQRNRRIKDDGGPVLYHDSCTKRRPCSSCHSSSSSHRPTTTLCGLSVPAACGTSAYFRTVKEHLGADTSPRNFWRRFPILSSVSLGLIATMLAAFILALVFSFHGGLASAANGVVDLNYARYRGVKLHNGVTQWLGMRYAAAPVGDLRFQAPHYPPHIDGIIDADQKMPGCMGAGPVVPAKSAEDCLYLDVHAPSAANTNSKLPVFVFIQGGGFNGDGGHFNGSGLIIASHMNMVVVSLTYRGGALGFLAGKELANGGSYNNGLKDQRRALEWVQMHIASFGGDPGHVAVGGQSAGAGSIVQHLTAYGGRNDNLFHAAAMESQSLPPVRTVADQQYQYDNLVAGTSCKGKPDTLACLRKLSIEDLQKATLVWPFPGAAGGKPVFSYNPVIDGDLIRDYPVKAFADGKFIKVPTIFGGDTDEGTVFTSQSISDSTQAKNFLKNNWPALTDDDLSQYEKVYQLDDADYQPYWLRASRAYGETRYTCPGIYLSNYAAAHGNADVWNFHFDVLDPANAAKNLGVPHGAELGAVWGDKYYPTPPVYVQNGADVVPVMQNYWVSFIRSFDPNKFKYATAPVWTRWSKTSQKRVHFVAKGTSMEAPSPDLMARCAFTESIAVAIKQ